MAVLVELVFPAAITIEMIDAVTDEMDVDTHLPAGGILHAHYEKDGRVHGVDVWESVNELGLPQGWTNPNGSGISLGHPIGATSAILTVKALHEVRSRLRLRARFWSHMCW